MESSFNVHPFGAAIGIFVTLLVFGAIGFAIKRRFRSNREYDERQKLAQGKAYQWAFYALICYLAAGGCFDAITGVRWCDLPTFAFIGVFFSIAVFAVACLAMDAYVPFRENPLRTIWILFLVGGINLAAGIVNCLTPGCVVADGVLTLRCVNLLCGILLVVIATAVCVKYSVDKRARDEEGRTDQ